MLTQKRQYNYLIKRWLLIRRHLMAYAASGDPESLHRVRVEVKKLKAFLQFARSIGRKKNAPSQPRSLKKMFRRAGMIRDAGIQLQLMQQFNLPDAAFRAGETQVIEQLSDAFREDFTYFDKSLRQTFRKLLGTLRPVRKHDVRHWLSRRLGAIAEMVASPGSDQLHEARKVVKSLVYFLGMLPGRLKRQSKINISYLDQLQDAIGKWHDLEVTVSMLISRKVGDRNVIGRLEKAHDRAGAAVHALVTGFEQKVLLRPGPL
ncbi:CHAD domain-containing protein [Chitinophaga rhizosphaerae]|uniref:CHAD domain-containing protein n=1 Tax=Chitinophaga rhizosphaerae TaxID=1864947 RepID=UPI000F7FE6A1|nr:CHAD domain-containing protein [Chitinophaga rhizosphaerae]